LLKQAPRRMGPCFRRDDDALIFARRANQQPLVFLAVQPHLQKYFCFSETKSPLCSRHPVPQEGRWPSSRTLGRDAVDAAAPARTVIAGRASWPVSDHEARRRTALLRTVKSCGPDASKVGVKSAEVLRARPGGQNLNPPMTVPKKPDRRGEHERNR
jgi:hypothetical protein